MDLDKILPSKTGKALASALLGAAFVLWLSGRTAEAISEDNSRDDSHYAPASAVNGLDVRLGRIEERQAAQGDMLKDIQREVRALRK